MHGRSDRRVDGIGGRGGIDKTGEAPGLIGYLPQGEHPSGNGRAVSGMSWPPRSLKAL